MAKPKKSRIRRKPRRPRRRWKRSRNWSASTVSPRLSRAVSALQWPRWSLSATARAALASALARPAKFLKRSVRLRKPPSARCVASRCAKAAPCTMTCVAPMVLVALFSARLLPVRAIAGGPMRAVFEALGIQDVVAKSVGTSNPHNMIKATFAALDQVTSPARLLCAVARRSATFWVAARAKLAKPKEA